MKVEICVSVGELLDKLTILEIKSAEITDPAKLENVRSEKSLLQAALVQLSLERLPEVGTLWKELHDVNLKLWKVEDELRLLEHRKDFGKDFVEKARLVYLTNDRRAALKREINRLTGSLVIEEKSYAEYKA